MDFWKTTEADVVIAEKSVETKKGNGYTGCMESWFGLLDSDVFPQIADKVSLYMLLYKYIARTKMSGDKANLYFNYYKKGVLASCVPANVLAERTGKSERTVYRQIKDFEDLGIVRVKKLKAVNSWDKQLHNIYILGTHLLGVETYFIDGVGTNLSDTKIQKTTELYNGKTLHKVQTESSGRHRHIC